MSNNSICINMGISVKCLDWYVLIDTYRKDIASNLRPVRQCWQITIAHLASPSPLERAERNRVLKWIDMQIDTYWSFTEKYQYISIWVSIHFCTSLAFIICFTRLWLIQKYYSPHLQAIPYFQSLHSNMLLGIKLLTEFRLNLYFHFINQHFQFSTTDICSRKQNFNL